MKHQNCVLRVNIQCACEGCKQKIKKTLNKTDGVSKTSIDVEQGKVTVYGNADPATLINKLNKSGRHAELWGQHKPFHNNKNQHQQMQATINKPSNKDQKSVMPVDGQDDFHDEFDNKGPSAVFELPIDFKGKGGNNDAKKGNGGKKGGSGGESGKKSNKGGVGGGVFGGFFRGKIGGALLGGGKKKQGEVTPKGSKKGGDGGQTKGGNLDKKGGKHHDDEGKFSSNKQNDFLEFNKPLNGRNMSGNPMKPKMENHQTMPQMRNHQTGQMGGYPMGQMSSAQGLPMAYRGQGVDYGNPYNQQQYQQQYQQQQYMQVMMNQPKANMYPQMMYGQPPLATYGPPMGAAVNTDNMTHMFSDENTDSCSIM